MPERYGRGKPVGLRGGGATGAAGVQFATESDRGGIEVSKTGWIDKGAVDGCGNGTGNGVDEINSIEFKGG